MSEILIWGLVISRLLLLIGAVRCPDGMFPHTTGGDEVIPKKYSIAGAALLAIGMAVMALTLSNTSGRAPVASAGNNCNTVTPVPTSTATNTPDPTAVRHVDATRPIRRRILTASAQAPGLHPHIVPHKGAKQHTDADAHGDLRRERDGPGDHERAFDGGASDGRADAARWRRRRRRRAASEHWQRPRRRQRPQPVGPGAGRRARRARRRHGARGSGTAPLDRPFRSGTVRGGAHDAPPLFRVPRPVRVASG